MAPIGFLLLLSIVIVGIVVTNWLQVTNSARDGARMAAICAGYPKDAAGPPAADPIPDGSSPTLYCNVGDLEKYMTKRLTAVPAGSVTPSISLCRAGTCTAWSNATDLPAICQPNALIEVEMQYPQPLYLPMVSTFFETTPNSGIRTLTAHAEVQCE